MKIYNQDISVLGDLTINPQNAQGDYLTLDASNIVKFRTAAEVASEIGAALGSDKTYVHDQSTPSATWTVAHNLNKKTSVMVVDTASTVVIGQIEYIDNNNVTLTFNSAFSGYAYFN